MACNKLLYTVDGSATTDGSAAKKFRKLPGDLGTLRVTVVAMES